MGAAASPVITSLISEDGSGEALGWPTYGYDDPTVHMVLFLDALLFVAFIFTCAMIYHWSREDTESAESLHGAKDTKFQLRQSKAVLGKKSDEDCNS